MNMKREAAKFIPKLHRRTIAKQMVTNITDEPDLLKRAIISGESWVYGYDIEMKAQSCQWKFYEKLRPKKKTRLVRSNVKIVLTVFFDYNGIVPDHTSLLIQQL